MTGSIASFLLRAVEEHPGAGIYYESDSRSQSTRFVSYPALLTAALGILSGLRSRVESNDTKIVLLLENPVNFIPALWACLLGGYIPCPLAPIRQDSERWDSHVAHVDALLEHPVVVGTGKMLSDLPKRIRKIEINELLRTESPDVRPSDRRSDVALLMLTSGSTGLPKAVELTHENIFASMRGKTDALQLTGSDVALNWIAFDHVAAVLESHMVALFVGASQVHASTVSVISDPPYFLRLIHDHRISLAFAPNFLLAQVNAAMEKQIAAGTASDPQLDLACVRHIVTGGEANVVATGVRFLELLAPYGLSNTALRPAFGMTETCAASVYSSEFPDCDVTAEFASVGYPISGLEMRIVDESGMRCCDGQTGELQLHGSVVFRSYFNNIEATKAAFTSDGWFQSGDIGKMVDSRLTLLSRSKDSIIVNGVNYFSTEIESKLELLEGIERSFVSVFPTRSKGANTEGVIVTFAPSLNVDNEDVLYQLLMVVRSTIVMLWGFRPTAILPLSKESFPKTSLGKIQRSLMRRRYESGDYDSICKQLKNLTDKQTGPYSAPENSMEQMLLEEVADTLKIDRAEFSATANFFDLGGTSLDILRMTHAIERRFRFQAGISVMLQNPSIRQLAACMTVDKRQARREYDPIVPLQTTGRKSPLFCVHPGNGEIFSLVNVAKFFANDRPFYAFRAPGFNQGERHFETFEELLSTYARAMIRRQPHGPYAIAGYSFGCSIAFELARMLESQGEVVAFLGCIDAEPVRNAQPLGFNMAAGLALVTDLIELSQCVELNDSLGSQAPSLDVCRRVLKFASQERLLELNLDLDRFFIWANVAHSMETILSGHANNGTVTNLSVFCSEGYDERHLPDYASTEKWRSLLRGWDHFAANTTYINVAGRHFTIMGPKYVAGFQSVLRAEIDRAFRDVSPK